MDDKYSSYFKKIGKKNFLFIYHCFIVLLSYSNSLPHFIYDGIESFHNCSGGKEEISFSIYGTLTDNKIDLKKMKIDDYFLEDIGIFKCSLQENELPTNEKRKHKIFCNYQGSFERKGYILDEPKVFGFDFNSEDGESSWPKNEERKSFLIGECGTKIELDDEPILLSSENNYKNPLDTIRKDIVDRALFSLPDRTSVDERSMCTAMNNVKNEYDLSEAESAYLVYRWLAENIVYDCYGLNHGNIDYTEEGTYNKGKGVCAGYSSIFETMCKSLGLESEYIIGYSKNSRFIPGVIPKQTDHAWNSVKIDSSYYLVDVTYGSGGCDGDNYNKKYSDFYFCTNPEFFIRSHLPKKKKWQLINPTISLQTFASMLLLDNDFYENGFKIVFPDIYSFISTNSFNVIFTFENNLYMSYIYKLYLLQEDTYIRQNNACFDKKGIGNIEATCFTNEKGKYKLKIFGGPTGHQSYPQIVEYNIESTTTTDTPLFFPTIYGLYYKSDIQLIEPLYSPLKKGNFYSFKITSTTYNNIYISMEKNHIQELDNNGNGEFTGENVYIHGENVAITILKDGYYQYILQYNTVYDPEIKEEPTFPQSYSAPKNVLFSPLKDILQRGKTYEFKIKCESVDDMIVIDGGNFIHLEKDGVIFSKTITIYGKIGIVQIASYTPEQYKVFYSYEISS